VVPFEAFETSDGPLIIAAANNRLFERLSTALGQPNWADDDRFKTNADRQENREALKALMEAELGQHDRAYWGEALSTAKVPSAPVQTIPEVSVHEQTQAIDMIQQVPGLDFQTMSIPLSFNGERPKIERAAPALGEHNDEVS
jgi:formyl-CoA transferase